MNFRDGSAKAVSSSPRRSRFAHAWIVALTFGFALTVESAYPSISSAAAFEAAADTMQSIRRTASTLSLPPTTSTTSATSPTSATSTASATSPATTTPTASTPSPASAPHPSLLDPAAAARFADLALSCLHREYPNKISHVMDSDKDALPPHVLTPAFYGCFDWHSAVHGHWLLVRLTRLYPNAAFATRARAELARSLTPENIAGEVSYLRRDGRASFERPYGLSWLLKLSAELRQWHDPQAQQWSMALRPLETEAATRLKS